MPTPTNCTHPIAREVFRTFTGNVHLPDAVDALVDVVCDFCGEKIADKRYCKIELVSFDHHYPEGNRTVHIDKLTITNQHKGVWYK